MGQRMSVVCSDDLAERIDALAREYGLPKQEVLRQLIERGLDDVESERRHGQTR